MWPSIAANGLAVSREATLRMVQPTTGEHSGSPILAVAEVVDHGHRHRDARGQGDRAGHPVLDALRRWQAHQARTRIPRAHPPAAQAAAGRGTANADLGEGASG
jgi:hypothetical protein